MGGDQAAGLRQWASGAAQEECPNHVAQALLELARMQTSGGASRPRSTAAAAAKRSAIPPTLSGNQELTLMVLGLPGSATCHTDRVAELLESWSRDGRRWVGDPKAWHIVALPVTSSHLSLLTTQQPRWALWVDDDLDAFRRGYRLLKQIAERGGPNRLIAVHPPGVGRQGLLNNLQYVAQAYFGIELLVLA